MSSRSRTDSVKKIINIILVTIEKAAKNNILSQAMAHFDSAALGPLDTHNKEVRVSPLIKTFVVKKKNRKYFECTLGKHRAKLLINEVSQNLSINSAVQLRVEDVSSRSKYGTELKFDPLAVLEERSEEDAEALRNEEPRRKEAEKWLAYAEDDASNGMFRSNAIKQSLALCPWHRHLLERLNLLKNMVDRNMAQHETEKWLSYAEADAQRGEVWTHAMSKALELCPQFDHLAERLAALKKIVYKDSEIDFINSIML